MAGGGSQTVTISDTASATEAISAQPSPLILLDSGLGLDALPGLFAHLTLPESGQGTDAASTSTGNITLHADLDRENLDVPNCSINGTDITLAVRTQLNEYSVAEKFYNFFGRVSGVNGLSPSFTLSFADALIAAPASASAFTPIWSTDLITWTNFDTVTTDTGANTATFSHSAPFATDTIYLAWFRPVRVADVTAWVAGIAATYPQYVSQTASAIAHAGDPYVCGQTIAQTDDSGRTVPPQPLYALRVSDDTQQPSGGNPKRTAVIFGGIHAGEDSGNVVTQYAVDFLLSADPDAVALRREYQFYIYPLVNPAGRWGGHYRGSWEPGVETLDPNRHIGDDLLDHMVKVREAVLLDTGGVPDIHFFYDLHGGIVIDWAVFTRERGHSAEIIAAIDSHATLPMTQQSIPSTTCQAWFADRQNCYYSITTEPGQLDPNTTITEALLQDGAIAHMRAMVDLLPSLYATHQPLVGESARGHEWPLGQANASAAWSHYYAIDTNAAMIASNVSDAHLVLTDALVGPEFWANVASDGRDIKVEINGVKCARHLEKLEIATQDLILWIKIPTLHATGDTLDLYFGNPAASETDTAGFFDTAYWPMDDGDGATLADLSGNGHHGALASAQTTEAAKLGAGTRFGGTIATDYAATDLYPDSSLKTLFGWMSFDAFTAGIYQLCGTNDGSNRRFYIGAYGDKAFCGYGDTTRPSVSSLTPGTLALIAMSINASGGIELSVNGAAEAGSGGTTFSGASTQPYEIGRLSNASNPIAGVIDALAISNTYRPAAWFSAYYNSVAAPGTFFTATLNTSEATAGPRWVIGSDTGQGADLAPPATVAALLADLANASDAPAIAVGLALADMGAGTDTDPGPGAQLSLSESAGGSDALAAINAAIASLDQGSGTDQLAAAVQTLVADTAAGTDQLDLIAEAIKQIIDSGQGVDHALVQIAAQVADSGQGSDTPHISVLINLVDSAQGADTLTLITEAIRTIADAALGSDALTVTVAPVTVGDSGQGSDTPTLTAHLTLAELGTGTDALVLSALKTIADAGAGTDAIGGIDYALIITIADQGQGLDLLGPVSVIAQVLEQAQGLEATLVAGNEPTRNATIVFRGSSAAITFTGRTPTITFRRGD